MNQNDLDPIDTLYSAADSAIESNGRLPEFDHVLSVARSTLDKVTKTASDRNLYPGGRDYANAEAIEEAERQIKASLDVAEAKLVVRGAELYEEARAQLPQAEAMSARADARMRLDAVKPADLPRTIAALARRADAVGALVSGEWGTLYQQSRGVSAESIASGEPLTRLNVFHAASVSGDAKRAAAAQEAFALKDFTKSRIAAANFARSALDKARKIKATEN